MSLGLGFVPAVAVFVWRLQMDNPDCYKKDSMQRVRMPYGLIFRRYWKDLAAISAAWYVLYLFRKFCLTLFDLVSVQVHL